jgi:acetyltransferase-like isoleucine patch superfamily enzyme
MSADRGPTYRHAARRILGPLTPVLVPARRARRWTSREALIIRLKTHALSVGATIEVDIAPDVTIAAPPFIEVYQGTWNRFVVGAGSALGDGLRLSFRGGSLEVGPDTEVRRLGTYHIGGAARVGAGVLLSHGVVMHCSDSIEIGDDTIVGEYTTITDSSHRRTPPGIAVHHATDSKPVRIGRNIWIGAHAMIGRGIAIGDQAFVGAGAVVTKDVAAGWLVAGVPARPIRELTVDT